ncbi:tetraspanin-4-like isoform X3 [Dermochelys coriacea]|uniref:tetraspanin-4-like isoform X3 n=1 Tax=Dermochelys coriacea TaxID=27794 RepID=UPI001CA8F158|nr:tetraspanin-4-like isoform X3 [Dermochelys coriacea]
MGPTQRCLFCLKLELFIFNLIFWLGGCGALGVGLWLALSQGRFSTLSLSLPSLGVAGLVMAAGAVVMALGFLGCLGAATEQRCLLRTFDRYAQDDLKLGLRRYGAPGEPALTQAWDTVQTEFRCCGVQNYTDWFEVRNGTGVPESCCLEHGTPCSGIGAAWWKEPCYEKVKSWVGENVWAMGIFAACITVVQVLGLVSSMLMYCQVLKVEKYYH